MIKFDVSRITYIFYPFDKKMNQKDIEPLKREQQHQAC
jgi:hypothetical protein